MDRIKTVMKFGGPLNTETSYSTWMVPTNHELDVVIRDLCVEGSIWGLGAQNNPLYLKRTNLDPIARDWHKFIIHNILPTTNQSEVTLNRARHIHCIMQSQEVQVEKVIVNAMMKIFNKLHISKPPLPFPNIIARLCEEMEVSYLALGLGEAVPKARPITVAKNQTEFYDSILAQQIAYGLRLQDMEKRQKDMWVKQQQFQQDVRNYQAQQKDES
ncbi:hypothetical protein PIB30_040954 [Stylosanthes scabra]|uniref:Putative plant transposon protein domain-containing protein n=1 Tax=Stylosanthes scabra TaxID=79078 RepID=A0ABU6REX3_9FABA|nr:hypothetical protein [Stylosanthes scabra]